MQIETIMKRVLEVPRRTQLLPGTVACLWSQLLWRLRQEDHLCPQVQDQPRRRSEMSAQRLNTPWQSRNPFSEYIDEREKKIKESSERHICTPMSSQNYSQQPKDRNKCPYTCRWKHKDVVCPYKVQQGDLGKEGNPMTIQHGWTVKSLCQHKETNIAWFHSYDILT